MPLRIKIVVSFATAPELTPSRRYAKPWLQRGIRPPRYDNFMRITVEDTDKVALLTSWIANIIGWAIAYLVGSIPTGYLAGKLLKGIDLREHGSKSTGATNVLRTLGKWPALAVLVIDVLKGAGAIIFARWFYPWLCTLPTASLSTALDPRNQQAWMPWAVCLAGLAVLLGHSRPIWLNFRGGKSVATGLGLLLAIAWPVGSGAVTVFGVVLAIFRIVSLGSILAALTAIVLVCSLEQPLPYRLLVIAGSLYVVVRHRTNIQRLLAGTEPRLGRSAVVRN